MLEVGPMGQGREAVLPAWGWWLLVPWGPSGWLSWAVLCRERQSQVLQGNPEQGLR